MSTYFVGLAVFVALLLAIVLGLFHASANAEHKRKQQHENRHVSHQPWDAHGNR